MPDPEPVINATLPFNFILQIALCVSYCTLNMHAVTAVGPNDFACNKVSF
jgi:hypothetical protein